MSVPRETCEQSDCENDVNENVILRYEAQPSWKIKTIEYISDSAKKSLVMPTLRVLNVDDSTYNLFVLTELINSIEPSRVHQETALNGQQAFDLVVGRRPSE